MGSQKLNRDKYITLANQFEEFPIFLQPWWLDLVCGTQGWGISISVDKEGTLKGVLVYCLIKKYGLKRIRQPLLSPYSGLWVNFPKKISPYRRNRTEKKIINELLAQLPKFDLYEQRHHYQLKNWLPFHWQGYSQTTQYTYLLSLNRDIQSIYNDIRYNVRWSIRNANKKELFVKKGFNLFEDFYQLYEETSRKKSIKHISRSQLRKISNGIKENKAGEIYISYDSSGAPISGAFILKDKRSAYYWLGARNPDMNINGAVAFLLWEIIKDYIGKVNTFDLEGSMNEGIEQFFSSFGAIQTPCFLLSKGKSKWVEILLSIKRKMG